MKEKKEKMEKQMKKEKKEKIEKVEKAEKPEKKHWSEIHQIEMPPRDFEQEEQLMNSSFQQASIMQANASQMSK